MVKFTPISSYGFDQLWGDNKKSVRGTVLQLLMYKKLVRGRAKRRSVEQRIRAYESPVMRRAFCLDPEQWTFDNFKVKH